MFIVTDLVSLTGKDNNHATIQLRTQHKTPHKSEENQAMGKEV